MDLVNRAALSLNWISGHKGTDQSPTLEGRHTSGKQQAILEHVWREALRRQAAAPQCCQGHEAALRALLKGFSDYDTGRAPGSLASYKPGAVSLPDSVHDCPELVVLASPACRPFLEEYQKRVRLDH